MLGSNSGRRARMVGCCPNNDELAGAAAPPPRRGSWQGSPPRKLPGLSVGAFSHRTWLPKVLSAHPPNMAARVIPAAGADHTARRAGQPPASPLPPARPLPSPGPAPSASPPPEALSCPRPT